MGMGQDRCAHCTSEACSDFFSNEVKESKKERMKSEATSNSVRVQTSKQVNKQTDLKPTDFEVTMFQILR